MMGAEEEKKESAAEKKDLAANNASKKAERGSNLSYNLVVIMLGILGVLVLFILIMPYWINPKDKELMEYYKWAFSVLLGAFGAWIGAGAAYFFGKENLQESSRSTESAMRIQQEFLGRPPLKERIKDMTLSSMNPNFFFEFADTKEAVTQKLADLKGYWFVPVIAKDTGILQDIIHAQVFWKDPSSEPKSTLEKMVSEMDKDPILKKLHGELFYVKVSLSDKISDVYNRIKQKDAEVAIVVDEKGKPSHWLSKTDLRSFLNM